MNVNWKHIKEVWDQGNENLSSVAKKYNITVPDIALKAQQEEWEPRGSQVPNPPPGSPLISINLDSAVLDDKQVTLAHKTDLGRLRLVSAAVMEALRYEQNPSNVLKAAEKLAKIYAIIIPLERKVFGIDSDSDGSPDGIIINVKNK